MKSLEKHITDWVREYISTDFEFREHQFETIKSICSTILTGKQHTQIIEAPTGSGKSLLNIISAGVLATYYDRTSYILCSDLYLWKQYEDFVNSHKAIKNEFGLLKGQTGNYCCAKNNQDMRNADCRMANIQWSKLFNKETSRDLGYDCAHKCPYVKARKKAIRSKVVIMTYQLYHYMINVVSEQSIGNSFRPKDIIFCDECHNIPKIVTSCFTPELKMSDLAHLHTLYDYVNNREISLFDDNEDGNDLVNNHITKSELDKRYKSIYKILSNPNSDLKTVNKTINDYHNLLGMFAETVKYIESKLAYKKQILKENFIPSEVNTYKGCSWFRNCMCLWNDFSMCVDEVGIEYVIRNQGESRLLNENMVTFTCAKEDYVVNRFLLGTTENRVLMSATLGGIQAFSENIGAKYLGENPIFTQLPSTFDFSKSPIYFLNRYKMSYAEKQRSLTNLKPIIYKICGINFKDQKGMIQTGSYSNAKEIYDSAPKEIQSRMLLYNNSKEKAEMIALHQYRKDTILIGPTLVDGIDLPGDLCRFIIILKVPYPVIVDDYVKLKMKLFPLWYNSSTSNHIIQGIGRGNRFKSDYCTTYILDACFASLYAATKDQYPPELKNRLKFCN